MDNSIKQLHTSLVEEIFRYDRAYYVDAQPAISDQDYDRLYRELLDLEASHPELITSCSPSQRVGGEPLEGFDTVQHALPMMSLDNTYSQNEVREFIDRVQKLLPNEELDWVVEPKADGIAISLRYEDGQFTVGATRGDGASGDDVTENLRTIRSIPLHLQSITEADLPSVFEARGEVIMTRSGFEKLNSMRETDGESLFANPRNATAGSIKQLDSALVAKRPLDIVLYGNGKVIGGPLVDSQCVLFEALGKFGFRTPKHIWNCSSAEQVVAAIARIPPKSVSSSDKELLFKLEDKLQMVVFGQDEAIQTLSTAIKMSRAGLSAPQKPIGSFLFAGPTGVGKTEVTRQLASVMGMELVRFDMSEYMERHTVSRLIGAPPGYVGYDQGGLLTEAVNKNPHCVLLLDEIEKAHPEVFNILLQVMDHGTLTDNNGRKTDFRNVILIMTTNAGADRMSRASIGFTHQDHSVDGAEELKKFFTPEFRNRIDNIIQFAPLSRDTILHVVDKFLAELQGQLDDKRVMLNVNNDARLWLAEHGYDEKMGARPMARLVQDKIKKPLAEKILFGDLAQGGEVDIDVEDGALVIEVPEAVPV